MAEYHFDVGDLEAEREAVLRALELRPNYAEALSRLSRIEARLEAAQDSMREIVERRGC